MIRRPWSVLCRFSNRLRDYKYFASDYSLYDSRIWQLSASSTYGFHAKSIISFLRFLYNLIIAVFRQASGYVWCEFMYDRMILLENLENYCGIDFFLLFWTRLSIVKTSNFAALECMEGQWNKHVEIDNILSIGNTWMNCNQLTENYRHTKWTECAINQMITRAILQLATLKTATTPQTWTFRSTVISRTRQLLNTSRWDCAFFCLCVCIGTGTASQYLQVRLCIFCAVQCR